MEKIIKELNLPDTGEYTTSGAYEITLPNSNSYSRYYSMLEKNGEVETMDDNALLTFNEGRMLYKYKDYLLDLQGDFKNNIYKLVISK